MSTVSLHCPACGGEVLFHTVQSVTATCSWCRSLLVRHDVDLEKLGVEAVLPPDVSLLQVGTRGVFQRVHFQIIGRLIVGWEDGRWNEWYVSFEDGRDGWLAEAQGDLAMSFQERDVSFLPKQADIVLGMRVATKDRRRYEVTDIREVSCLGVEGELPLKAFAGRAGLSVDLVGEGPQFACIEYSGNELRFFTGQYVSFDELRLMGLKE